MSNPLDTYLHDHLAGAAFALELLAALRDQHKEEPLGVFAAGLRVEIEESRSVLRDLAERVSGGSNVFKEATGWLAEKAARFKLRPSVADALGSFEALEMLSLGTLGQAALWTMLGEVVAVEPRLRGPDYAALAARARDQHERVERQRLAVGRAVFGLPAA